MLNTIFLQSETITIVVVRLSKTAERKKEIIEKIQTNSIKLLALILEVTILNPL